MEGGKPCRIYLLTLTDIRLKFQVQQFVIPLEIRKAFKLDRAGYIAKEHGKGNIQQTYAIYFKEEPLYILQKINPHIFPKPWQIADNWERAADYLNRHAPDYQMVRCISATTGDSLIEDTTGCFWRLMPFIKNSCSYSTAIDLHMARQAASAFGKFVALLSEVKIESFHAIIPDFHDVSLRKRQYDQALDVATPERKELARELIDHLKAYHWITEWYSRAAPQMPKRLMHMDAKMDNILFDCTTREFRAIIDFDTLMPGLIISDIGDLIRTMACSSDENETDFGSIFIRSDIVQAIHETYFDQVEDFLTEAEREYMLFGGPVLVYMQALRFLTDYLSGDVYYKTKYQAHNLMRAINQKVVLQKLLKEPVYAPFIL